VIKAVRAEPEADEELRAAARWYEGKRLGLGRDFLAAIGAAIEVLQQHPAGGSRVPRVKRTLPVRRLILRRFPYSVVFLELEAEIRILAFAHHRRRPGYWLKRIRS
jgi:plasmid stabilization system protein ParE